jgi:predicted  nucleic acid-binding Zn-ribbon protein
MTSAADLFALQEIDLRRDARRALIADIEARLVETEELIDARRAVASAEAAHTDIRRQQADIETQLDDLDAKIQPLEKRLYDGSVRNPKELTDLQREVDSLKARRSKLDDQGLALLEASEAAAATLDEARATLERVDAEWRADQEDLRAEKAQAEADTDRLNEDRGLRTQGMDAAPLGLYEKLRSTKQGRAVARVERGACQGCRVSLPTHLVQRLRAGGELVQCPRCERILVSG